jgi:hypothetical protein
MKTLWPVFVAIALIIVIVGVAFVLMRSAWFPTSEELAQQGAEQARALTTFPEDIDEVTTLTDSRSEGSEIQYYYELHDYGDVEVTADLLRDTVQPRVCSTSDTRTFLERGVALSYHYTARDSGETYAFTVNEDNC